MEMKFDMEKLMEQMKDYAVMGFILGQIEKEDDRKFFRKAMEVFMEYSIPVDKGFEILVKISKLVNEDK